MVRGGSASEGGGSYILWRSDDWTDYGPTGGQGPTNKGFASLDGTISIRAVWVGDAAPSGVANVVLDASMSARGGVNSACSVNDGVNPPVSGSPEVSSSGKRLIQLGNARDKTITVTARGTISTQNGAGEVLWGFRAGLDRRSAAVACEELSPNYFIKGSPEKDAVGNAVQSAIRIQSYTWLGSEELVVGTYERYKPQTADPIKIEGPVYKDERTIGMPVGWNNRVQNGWDPGNTDVLVPNKQPFTFKGSFTVRDPTTFTLSRSKGNFNNVLSGSLPRPPYGDSTMPSLPPVTLFGPLVTVQIKDGRSESASTASRSDDSISSNLDVAWGDGVTAKAEMNLTLKDQFADEEMCGAGVRATMSNQEGSFTFDSGANMEPLARGAQPVRLSSTGDEYKAMQNAVAVGAILFGTVQPEAAAFLSLLGAGMSFGEPKNTVRPLAPEGGFTRNVLTATRKVVVEWGSISSAKRDEYIAAEGRIENNQGTDEDRELIRNLRDTTYWRAGYLPYKHAYGFVRDVYSLSGFNGRSPRLVYEARDPDTAPCRSFYYRIGQGGAVRR